ncbi:MAG: hypothetical protein WD772_03160 [Pseudohongiellaceae bacterium]
MSGFVIGNPLTMIPDASTKRGILRVEHGEERSLLTRILAGDYGLAITYWILYFIGAAVFFVTTSQAVDRENWLRFMTITAVMLGYTVLLLVGIRSAYKGPQLWKVMSRTSSVFMIINILVGISALGFIY